MNTTKQQFTEQFDSSLASFIENGEHSEYLFTNFFTEKLEDKLGELVEDSTKEKLVEEWCEAFGEKLSFDEFMEAYDSCSEDVAQFLIENKDELKTQFINYTWQVINTDEGSDNWWNKQLANYFVNSNNQP